MTPGARIAAAIDIVDRVAQGQAAEQALLHWARGARYAGSKDRAAVRDHVFDVLRRWRSAEAHGGGATGRARLIGLLRMQGIDLDDVFTGQGHAPQPLSDAERGAGAAPQGAAARDLPDWLSELFEASHGAEAPAIAEALRHRAPVFLRANLPRAGLSDLQAALAQEGVEMRPHPLSDSALEVVTGARRLTRTAPFQAGWFELQDVASQAVVDRLPLASGMRVLDYCAGGGGKALAMVARAPDLSVFCWDANPARMSDIPIRAARAGADLQIVKKPVGPYDLVVCDAPCSGSGAWRRSPEGKWRLTPERLAELVEIQAEILRQAARLVAANGALAYVTCSVLQAENRAQIEAFLATHPQWQVADQRQFLPADGGDGFFYTCLRRGG